MLDATLPITTDLVRDVAHRLTGSPTDYDHNKIVAKTVGFDVRKS